MPPRGFVNKSFSFERQPEPVIKTILAISPLPPQNLFPPIFQFELVFLRVDLASQSLANRQWRREEMRERRREDGRRRRERAVASLSSALPRRRRRDRFSARRKGIRRRTDTSSPRLIWRRCSCARLGARLVPERLTKEKQRDRRKRGRCVIACRYVFLFCSHLWRFN